MRGAITDTGTPLGTMLGAKDSGFFVTPSNNQRGPAALFMLAAPGAKVRPTVTNQSNYRFTASYAISLAPGETVSVLHCLAQRNVAGATDAKSLAKLFAPLRSPRLLAEIPARERKSLVNFATSAGAGAATVPAVASVLEKLHVARGPLDILAIGETTRLKGAATCAALEIETAFGRTQVPFEKVAAIVGGAREARLILRDGQALRGRLTARGLKFTLTSGSSMALDVAALDRLVLRETPPSPPDAAAGWGLVETFEGDRLAVRADPQLRLRANTAWGVCDLTPDDLVSCAPTEESPLGFRVQLKDGSRFVALLDGDELAFDTVLFGRKNFRTAEIRQIAVLQSAPPPGADADAAETPPDRAQVIIAGGQLLAGQIDLAELHFLSPAGAIPVAPSLLRELRNTDEEGAAPAPIFNAEIWGGGAISGALRELVVPVRACGAVFQIPVRDLLSATVPAPRIPEGLRDKVAALIRDLGHPDWERREAAGRELGELGAMSRAQLQEAVSQTADAEVRRRAQTLLDAIETP